MLEMTLEALKNQIKIKVHISQENLSTIMKNNLTFGSL